MLSLQLTIFLCLSSMSVTSVMGISFLVRTESNYNKLLFWNSSLRVITMLDLPGPSSYPIYGDYDSTRHVYVVGNFQYPMIGLLNVTTNVFQLIEPANLSTAAQLMCVASTSGFVFALVQDNSQFMQSIYKIDTDTTFKTSTPTYQLVGKTTSYKDLNFLLGSPLGYDSTTNKFYAEVEYYDYQRQMVEISIDNVTKVITIVQLDWLTGWIKLWYLSSCPNHLIGYQKGSLYSIDIANNKIVQLFSPPSFGGELGNNPHIDVVPTTGQIYTLSMDQYWELNAFDFNGNSIQVLPIPGMDPSIIGLQMIPDTSDIIGNCPNKNTPAPTSFLGWLIEYGLAIIIVLGAGLLMALAIGGLVLLKVSRRSNYSEIMDSDNSSVNKQGRAATEALHDALHASGGKIDADEIDIKDLIGHGSFANVYYGLFHDTEVAIKVIKFVSMKDMEKSLLEEAGLMVKLRHPHIVLFMGACVKTPDLFIVTEFMENGSIRELLDEKSVTIEEEHIRVMAIDACKGMAFLHSRKILHRDLKSHNLLVDKFWNVKVADFGLSRAMGDTEGTMTACGTPSWAAPEVLRRDHYSFKADVYSFGVCLWEMCTRQRPYADLKPYQVVIAVATDGLRPTIDPKVVAPYFEQLLRQCWIDKPDDRPEFPRIRELLDDFTCPTPRTPTPSYYKRKESTKSKSAPTVLPDSPLSNSSKEMKTRKKFYEQIDK